MRSNNEFQKQTNTETSGSCDTTEGQGQADMHHGMHYFMQYASNLHILCILYTTEVTAVCKYVTENTVSERKQMCRKKVEHI